MNYKKITIVLGITLIGASLLSGCGKPQMCLYGTVPEESSWEETVSDIDFIDIETRKPEEEIVALYGVEAVIEEDFEEISKDLDEDTNEETILIERKEDSPEGCISIEEAKQIGILENPETKEENVFSDTELSDMEDVDIMIRRLVESEEFKDADLDKRKELGENLLKELLEKKLIKDYKVFDGDSIITFTYNSGALGGIQVTSFDPDFN